VRKQENKDLKLNKKMIPFNFKTYKKNLLFVDIETIGDIKKGEKAFPYDVSIMIVNNETNEMLYKKAFINSKLFYNKLAMSSAFYNNQDFYIDKLANDNDYILLKDYEIAQLLNDLIKKYNITTMVAYNCQFDRKGLDNLYSLCPSVKNGISKLLLVDLWEYAYQVCGHSEKYKQWCLKHNYITKKGTNYLSNAETVYKFVSETPDFKEKHTGLCDLDIELLLFKAFRKIHPRLYPNELCGGHKFLKGGLLRTDS